MNKNVSIWRGNKFPPTTKHVWIDDENNFLLHDGSEWKVVINIDGNNSVVYITQEEYDYLLSINAVKENVEYNIISYE